VIPSKCDVVEAHFPSMNWQLLDQLYTAHIGSPGERQHYNDAVTSLCTKMCDEFSVNSEGQSEPLDGTWINKNDFDSIMGKVIGCGHAVKVWDVNI